ncbi:MAG: acyl-CoA thioesterase [Gemmatimonadetes bacterium]|nr:acyl-CoA thioesterase [Gemmatimonadota bacterium]
MSAKPFLIDEYVRWSDVDMAGIIFYGAYVRFFEIAETEMFRSAGIPYASVFDRFDVWLPRAHMDCDFEYPARLDDNLRVAAYFTKFGRTSIGVQFDVAIPEKGVLAATGHEVLVCTDRKTLKPKPIPEELKKILQQFACTETVARAGLGLKGGA